MADNIFRSFRGREPAGREEDDPSAEAGDPLAELARLIGQSVPRGELRDERYAPAPADDQPAAGLDWAADESYAPERDWDDGRQAPPLAHSQPSYPQRDSGYADEPTIGRFFAGSAPRFSEDAAEDAGYQGEHEPDLPGQRSASFPLRESDDRYAADEEPYDEEYAAPAYRDASGRRRRGGLVVVVAVLALAVLGTAGAFGYRAMFGSSVLPALPPIIKPANGPNKIVPNYGDAQANNASSTGAADTNSSEKLVSHEEQPVQMEEAPRAAPRIVSTIPIPPSQPMPPPGMAAPPAPLSAASNPAPVAAPPVPAAALPPTAAAPVAPAATGPAAPKKVHTVVIRADQPASADAASPPAPASAPQSASRATASAPKSARMPAGANHPLSLVPGQQGDAAAPAPAPAPRMRVTAAPPAAATAEPAPPAEAAPPSGGGYSVQVTSQRSEADAQAAFRALKAKFPNQLGGREAVIRRADLGAKGTFYRALVGSFASAEEASSLCSALKAAGGNCLVQRN